MAEIKIRKKKPIWPWILLIIIVAILAFLYFYGSLESDDSDAIENDDMEEVTNISAPVFHYNFEMIS